MNDDTNKVERNDAPRETTSNATSSSKSGFFRELFELTRIRILLFVRESEAMFWVLVFPIVLAAVLGAAFRNTGVEPSVVIVPNTMNESAADAVAVLRETDGIDLRTVDDEADAVRAFARRKADLVLLSGTPPRLRFDPDRPEGKMAELRVRRALAPDEGPMLREEPATGIGSRYIDWLFPGLLGMNIMGTGMWFVAFSIVEQRQKKLLKRYVVTPMHRTAFLSSFAVARLAFLFLEVGLLILFARLLLKTPFVGSAAAFIAVSLLGAFTFGAIGVLCASRAKTIQGISGLLNFAMTPMWLGSGIFFSYERFPEFLHPLLRLLPLTALNDALRNIMLDGEGFVGCASEMIVLAVWGTISIGLGLKLFRWS